MKIWPIDKINDSIYNLSQDFKFDRNCFQFIISDKKLNDLSFDDKEWLNSFWIYDGWFDIDKLNIWTPNSQYFDGSISLSLKKEMLPSKYEDFSYASAHVNKIIFKESGVCRIRATTKPLKDGSTSSLNIRFDIGRDKINSIRMVSLTNNPWPTRDYLSEMDKFEIHDLFQKLRKLHDGLIAHHMKDIITYR